MIFLKRGFCILNNLKKPIEEDFHMFWFFQKEKSKTDFLNNNKDIVKGINKEKQYISFFDGCSKNNPGKVWLLEWSWDGYIR